MEPEARELLCVLNVFEVDYVLVGGVAMQAHGVPHLTADVDVVIAPDPANRGPLGRALEALHAQPRTVGPLGQSFATDLGDVDILDYTNGMGDYAAWRANAALMQLGQDGPSVRVAALGDIELDKQRIGRQKDQRALELITRFRDGELEPSPGELLLGPRPTDPRERQRWELVARMVDRFREQHGISSPEPLGSGALDEAGQARRDQILRLAEQIAPEPPLEPDTAPEI